MDFPVHELYSGIFRIGGLINAICFIILLYNGTLMATRHWFYIQVCGLFIIGSVIMKIMHLQGADIVLILPNSFIILIYIDHFRKKPEKRPLDVVKLLWVLISFFITPLILLRIIPSWPSMVSYALMAVAMVLWLMDRFKVEPGEEVLDDE